MIDPTRGIQALQQHRGLDSRFRGNDSAVIFVKSYRHHTFLIIALIIGAITGWIMSMPIGPVNAAAISRTLKYSYRFGVAVGIGAAVMDVIYCGGAAQINQFLVKSPVINLVFELVGFGALLILGIRQLTSKMVAHDTSYEDQLTQEPDRGERVAAAAIKKMHLEKKSLVGPF